MLTSLLCYFPVCLDRSLRGYHLPPAPRNWIRSKHLAFFLLEEVSFDSSMLSCLGYFCVRADIYDTHVPIFSFQNLHTDDQLYVSGVCSVHIFITAVSLLLRPIFSLTGSRDLTITFRNSNIQSYPLLHWGLLNTILSSVEIVVS